MTPTDSKLVRNAQWVEQKQVQGGRGVRRKKAEEDEIAQACQHTQEEPLMRGSCLYSLKHSHMHSHTLTHWADNIRTQDSFLFSPLTYLLDPAFVPSTSKILQAMSYSPPLKSSGRTWSPLCSSPTSLSSSWLQDEVLSTFCCLSQRGGTSVR